MKTIVYEDEWLNGSVKEELGCPSALKVQHPSLGKNYYCCLGFRAEQKGFALPLKPASICSVDYPSELGDNSIELSEALIAEINDDPGMSMDERKAKLKHFFEEAGEQIEFVPTRPKE